MTRAAYLGPPGTFSEEALLASGVRAEGLPLETVRDVVLAVQEGRADRAVVPIESAAEGSVDATLDALVQEAPDVAIVGEIVLPVRHALVAAPGTQLTDVRAVVSHPQALAQCARFIRRELPGASVVAATSTADAVREVVGEGPGGARVAIGTLRAAELYGGAVLREGVEDSAGNATRFVWVARATPGDTAEGATRTSLAFDGAGAGEAGWLVRCLSEFAFRGVNLTRIESRPRRDGLGRYVFFVDLDGGLGDERVAGAVEALRAHCDSLRVLGTYPAG